MCTSRAVLVRIRTGIELVERLSYLRPGVVVTNILIIVSLDESREYLGFSTVTSPYILGRPFKFGMWVYMGNATNAIVFLP